jgi:hypothetical protein
MADEIYLQLVAAYGAVPDHTVSGDYKRRAALLSDLWNQAADEVRELRRLAGAGQTAPPKWCFLAARILADRYAVDAEGM